MRRDDGNLRPELADPLEDSLLVSRVGVCIEQADGDRLDALLAEVVDDRGQADEVERAPHDASVRDPLGYLAPEVARHERGRLLVVEIEVVGPVATGDLD